MISLCMTVYGRQENMEKCLESITKATKQSGSKLEVIIADWNRDHTPVEMALRNIVSPADIPYTVVACTGAVFSRGEGLNKAAAAGNGDILFFTDVDILVESDVLARIPTVVDPEHSWFPICRDELKKGGWRWRKNGKGVCGVHRTVYEKVGKWPEIYRWGMEDLRFYKSVLEQTTILRDNTAGLYHMWHTPLNSNIEVKCTK